MINQFQRCSRAMHPLHEDRAAEVNARRRQASVLTIEREVRTELIDQPPGQQADIGQAVLQPDGQTVPERRRTWRWISA